MQAPILQPKRHKEFRGDSAGKRASSGQPPRFFGLLGDVFVKARDSEQELEHAVPLFRIGSAGVFFEALYNGKGIGQQPFNVAWRHVATLAASAESLVGPQKRFFQKMVEAELLVSERGRDGLGARGPSAVSGSW